ncbi:MAG TPA: 7-cyano-7-deazaguanine synthase QueC [Acidiferrobacteraceae bacterium]|nr:7-cyano-7-deazaguanine synthase QueC [Acidiferrobacteraceae bacterium]
MAADCPEAVVLISGGLDSATTLALAREQGFDCYALSFDYGQRHAVELDAARIIAAQLGARQHRVLSLPMGQLGGSALTDRDIEIPCTPSQGIPVTYVPARNTVFLAMALSWAEVLHANHIFIGANAVDYSGYPDCRPQFIQAFEGVANLGTREGIEGKGFEIHAPLINMTKAEIIKLGLRLGVDYSQTISCYAPDERGRGCSQCDSCRLRATGFAEAGVSDPTCYNPAR